MQIKDEEHLLVRRNNYSFHRKSKSLMVWMSEIIKVMGGDANLV